MRRAAATGDEELCVTVAGLLAVDAADAVSALTSARTRLPLGFSGQSASTNFSCLVGGRSSLVDRLQQRVALNDFPDDTVPAFNQCLSDIVKSDNTYRLQGATTVRPDNRDLLNICSADHTSVPLEPLLDGDALAAATDPESWILSDEDDLCASGTKFAVYSDPALKDRDTLLELIVALRRRDLICFRRRRYGWVGVFTVDKKKVQLRLVFDCRASNELCRSPPIFFLSAPSRPGHSASQ